MNKPKSEKSQRERFVEAARELGCNEDEEAFKRALGNVARHKPKDKVSDKGDSKDK